MSAPDVHGPAEMPDLRLWLAEQWLPGKPFHRAAAPYHASRAHRALLAGGRTATHPDQVEGYANHERTVLNHATLWWVAESMVDLLLAAAAGVPDDTMMGDLPQMPATGLVVFAKPWLGIDGTHPGHQVTVDALSWGVVSVPERDGPGRRLALAISTYRRLDFAMGLSPDELGMANAVGAMAHGIVRPLLDDQAPLADKLADRLDVLITHPQGYAAGSALPAGDVPHAAYGTVVSGPEGGASRLVGTTWVPLGRSDWPLPDPIGTGPWGNEPGPTLASMVEDRKVVAALWHLLHQEGIAQQTVHRPERQAVRRTQRAGVEPKLASVQVVTLRKLHRTESVPSDDHEARQWTHRWLVHGHWRWQPHGPGRTLRRLTYIRPHVKGPDDLPLRVPTRVNSWVR